MTSNPFESPRLVDDVDRVSTGRLHAIVVGFFGGAFVGGTAGAIQAIIIALLVLYRLADRVGPIGDAPFRESIEPIVVVTVASIFGGLGGAGVGCFVGPILGAVAGFWGPKSKPAVDTLAIAASTVSAVVLSLFGSQVLIGNPTEPMSLIVVVSAICVGTMGGIVLARGIARLVWENEP